jgi:hypothetical protein
MSLGLMQASWALASERKRWACLCSLNLPFIGAIRGLVESICFAQVAQMAKGVHVCCHLCLNSSSGWLWLLQDLLLSSSAKQLLASIEHLEAEYCCYCVVLDVGPHS